MTTALYYRVSSELQAEANSIASQRFAMSVMFAARGWDYAGAREYIDEARSGADNSREAYTALKRDIEAGSVDRLCVYDMDRVSRDPDERSAFVRLCMERGVKITEYASGDLDPSSPMGMLLERIRSALAEFQRSQIKARTRVGIRAKIAAGQAWGGARSPGKRQNQNGHKRFTADESDQVVRLRKEGKTILQIAGQFASNYTTVRKELVRRGELHPTSPDGPAGA